MTMHDRTTRGDGEAGFSFIEATIASAMLLLLSWLVATLAKSGMDSQQYNDRQGRVTEITQELADEMRAGLASSIRLMGNDAVGNAYRAMVELPSSGPVILPPPIASSRLPTIQTTGRFERETLVEPRSGNDLMFVRYAWTYEFEATSLEVYRVDVYRVERYYLTPVGNGPEQGSPTGLNLARWVSEPFADASQVDSISSATDAQELRMAMRNSDPDRNGTVRPSTEVLWNIGADPSLPETMRHILIDGSLSNTPTAPRAGTWELEAELALCDGDLLDYRHHSITSVFAPERMGVGRFSLLDQSGDGFPHGFEIQAVGPSSSRSVLVHLTICSTRAGGQRAFQDVQVVADIRDV